MKPSAEYWCLTRDLDTGKVVRMERILEPVHIETLDTSSEASQ